MKAAPASNRQLHAHDGFWLSLAIVFHALLLAIPLTRPPVSEPAARSVQLTLGAPDSIAHQSAPAPEGIEPETPIHPVEPDLRHLAQQAEVPDPEESEEEIPLESDVLPSTALLLDSASQFDWPDWQADDHLQLGKQSPGPIPTNRLGGFGQEDNLFYGMAIPRKTVVVDRWLAADGSHEVVINIPNGETLCGRALPWNPMQPLVEHVMRFRPCGGGGKRTFTMPQRVSGTANTIGMANSTIN